MSFDVLIEFIKAVFLGRSGPGLDSDPLVVVTWLGVPGLLRLAQVYAGRDRDGPAAIHVGLALLLGGVLLANGYSRYVPPAARPERPTVPQPPASVVSFDIHDGHTLIGGDLRSAADLRQQRISLQACQNRCADDAACIAFSYDKSENSCVLKGAVTERKPFAAAVSGIRRGTDSAGGKR